MNTPKVSFRKYMDGAWRKVTLTEGIPLELQYSGETEEGYYRVEYEYLLEEGVVTMTVARYGSDCDGPHE